jgi:hypothetical protein
MPWFQGTVTYYFMSLFFFVISLFFFRCAIVSHGKLAGGKKSHTSCLLYDWILYIMGNSNPFDSPGVFFSKFPLLFSFRLLYSSLVINRLRQGNPWPRCPFKYRSARYLLDTNQINVNLNLQSCNSNRSMIQSTTQL